MKTTLLLAAVLLAACSKPEGEPTPPPASTAPNAAGPSVAPSPPLTGQNSEKEKALANPYPNDLGPAALTAAELAAYSPELRKGYDLLISRCAQCHAASRPLNSRFVEVSEAELAKLPKALLADKAIRQVEPGVWNRYVKRMMNKPGCAIAKAEGKLIWEFLAADGKVRKLGANAEKWEAHRKGLLADFKTKHPKRFAELSAAGDL